jgi:hypothetical protein
MNSGKPNKLIMDVKWSAENKRVYEDSLDLGNMAEIEWLPLDW